MRSHTCKPKPTAVTETQAVVPHTGMVSLTRAHPEEDAVDVVVVTVCPIVERDIGLCSEPNVSNQVCCRFLTTIVVATSLAQNVPYTHLRNI